MGMDGAAIREVRALNEGAMIVSCLLFRWECVSTGLDTLASFWLSVECVYFIGRYMRSIEYGGCSCLEVTDTVASPPSQVKHRQVMT